MEKGMSTHSSILAWRFHGQRRLVGYSPWGYKELDTTERLTLSLSYFKSIYFLSETHLTGHLVFHLAAPF